MDIANIISFVLGLFAGVVGFALVLPVLNKRSTTRQEAEIGKYEQLVADLRRERADDRETNRRLRHEIAINTPHNFELAREERDAAVLEVERLGTKLREAAMTLGDRDRSLREARLAIHDIRVQLERGDRFVDPVAAAVTTGDHPAGEILSDSGDGTSGAHDDANTAAHEGEHRYSGDVGAGEWPGGSDADFDDLAGEMAGQIDSPRDGDGAEDGDDEDAATVFFGEYPVGDARSS